MTAILALFAIAYAVAWLFFWAVEVDDAWQHVFDIPPDEPARRVFTFLLFALLELIATFFWPFLLAKGAGFVWDAAPDFGEDEEEDDEEEEP